MHVNDLKNVTVDRADLDHLVALSAFGRGLVAEYEHLGIDEPEWVGVNLKTVRREIRSRNADKLEAALRDKRARLEALKTPTERKTALQKEIKELERELEAVA